MTETEPWTADDERIRRTRQKMRDAEDLLLYLRDQLNDNISQRRASLQSDDATLCPVCGRVLRISDTGLIEAHGSIYAGRQCRGTGLDASIRTFDGGL